MSTAFDVRFMTNRIFKLTKCIANALKVKGTDIIHWDGDLTSFGVRSWKSGGRC